MATPKVHTLPNSKGGKTPNAKAYEDSLNAILKQYKLNLSMEQEKQILNVYKKAFRMISKKIKDCGNETVRKKVLQSYCIQLYNEILPLVKSTNSTLSRQIINANSQMIQELGGEDSSFLEAVNKSVDITNRNVVNQIISGQLYMDGKSLDRRLWNIVNRSGERLDAAIASCIAQGQNAAEMSKTISEFAKKGHKVWDRGKIREKLGSSYASKYGNSGLDYEALRLARTTINHQAQISMLRSSNVNPYMTHVRWRSSHTAGRTCDLCISRDGTIFEVGKCPLDHPNGMCFLEPMYSIKGGKPGTLQEKWNEIVEDMRKWGKGLPNSGTMNKNPEFAKVAPKVASKKKPKPKESILSKFLSMNRTDKDYTKVRREAQNEISDKLTNIKSKLSKQYRSIDESYVKNIVNGLSPTVEDAKAYSSYVRTGNSFKINRHLYSGYYAKGNDEQTSRGSLNAQINALTDLINKGEIKDNSKFVRFVDRDYLQSICKQLAVPNDLATNHTYQDRILRLNARLSGKVIKQDAFTSVSYDIDKNVFTNKPILMEVYTDKGTKALYTSNYRESEIVLQRGINLEILGFELVKTTDSWGDEREIIKLLVKTVS